MYLFKKAMEFKERLEQTFGDRLPKNPEFSAITRRIILTQKEYNDLQRDFTLSAYNKWCTGINKGVDPESSELLPFDNYLDTGDAKSFRDLFVAEREAEVEAKEAAQQPNTQKK